MIVHHYDLMTNSNVPETVIAVCSDLHDHQKAGIKAIKRLQEIRPSIILLPGDIVENNHTIHGFGLDFLRECASIAPSFMSLGNHETGGRHQYRKGVDKCLSAEEYRNLLTDIRNTGVSLLDNECVHYHNMWIGGLTSPLYRDEHEHLAYHPINQELLLSLSQKEGFRILLNHHPEIFVNQIDAFPFDLSVSGHAHGGQIRLFGQGLFAPGQGILPSLTKGHYRSASQENHHLIISTGLSNNTFIPRFGNPTELVIIHLKSKK